MKQEWIDHSLRLCRKPSGMYSGCRKIHRHIRLTFLNLDDSLQLADAGFTSNKMRYLEKNYLHVESQDMAVKLWERRCEQAKYGSVGMTCYNHLIKGDVEKKSKRASVMGPCVQAVTLTWVDRKNVSVDVFYRTTEVLKKFPADLVFIRDVLLKPFHLPEGAQVELNCHFANLTVHPMYFATLLPHLGDPEGEMNRIRDKDRRFFDWMVKWTARYACPEHHRGIAKFAQALRVQKALHDNVNKEELKALADYLRENHPGHQNDYVEDEEDDA